MSELIFAKKKIKQVFNDDTYFDAVIGLLAASVQNSTENITFLFE